MSNLIVPHCPLRSPRGIPLFAPILDANQKITGAEAKANHTTPGTWQVATCTVTKFLQGLWGGVTYTWMTQNGFTSGEIFTGPHPPYAVQTPFSGSFGPAVYGPTSKLDIVQKTWTDIFSQSVISQVDTSNPANDYTITSSLAGPGKCAVVDSGSTFDPFIQEPQIWSLGEPLNAFPNGTTTQTRTCSGPVDTSGLWALVMGVLNGMTPGVDGAASWDEAKGMEGGGFGQDPNSFTGQLSIGPGGFGNFGGGGTLLGSVIACGGSLSGGAGLADSLMVQKQTARLVGGPGTPPALVLVVHWRAGLPKGAIYDLTTDNLLNVSIVGIYSVSVGQTIGSDPTCNLVIPFPGAMLPVQALGTNVLVAEWYAAIPISGSGFANQWITEQGYKWGDNFLT